MTTPPDRPRFEYTVEERAAMLRGMRGASDYFYSSAVRIGVHAFIEFAGLMNEFIKLCEEAHAKGIDFTMANVHTDQHLPFQPHHIAYLNEKLECIYGMRFTVDDPTAYMTPEHAVTAPSIPPSLLGGPSLTTLAQRFTAAEVAVVTEVAAPAYTPGGYGQPEPEVCGADNSVPYEYTTLGEKCQKTKPCPDHDEHGKRRRPWNS